MTIIRIVYISIMVLVITENSFSQNHSNTDLEQLMASEKVLPLKGLEIVNVAYVNLVPDNEYYSEISDKDFQIRIEATIRSAGLGIIDNWNYPTVIITLKRIQRYDIGETIQYYQLDLRLIEGVALIRNPNIRFATTTYEKLDGMYTNSSSFSDDLRNAFESLMMNFISDFRSANPK